MVQFSCWKFQFGSASTPLPAPAGYQAVGKSGDKAGSGRRESGPECKTGWTGCCFPAVGPVHFTCLGLSFPPGDEHTVVSYGVVGKDRSLSKGLGLRRLVRSPTKLERLTIFSCAAPSRGPEENCTLCHLSPQCSASWNSPAFLCFEAVCSIPCPPLAISRLLYRLSLSSSP